MLSRTEIERLAGMANALRPDWPVKSVCTYIGTHFSDRSYRDVACALAYIGTDTATENPGRLAESGPWWKTTEESRRPPTGRTTPCHRHPDQPASRCQPCADEPKASPERIAEIRKQGRKAAAEARYSRHQPTEEDEP